MLVLYSERRTLQSTDWGQDVSMHEAQDYFPHNNSDIAL